MEAGGSALSAAVISEDPGFVEDLRGNLRGLEHAIGIDLDISAPFTEIDDSHLERLKSLAPDIAFLDLERDPHVGIKFAQFMAESGFARSLIGFGNTDSPEVLLEAMRAGVTEYVGKPVQPEALDEALTRVLRKMGRRAETTVTKSPAEVYVIFSPKGGTGATTVAANLAIETHRLSRKRTLLVDLDLELGESALVLGVEPKFSVVDLMRNFHRVDSGLLASYIERHESGVEILSAPYQPADYEAVSGDRVRQVLAFLKEHYDYILIDSPKTFTPATLGALEEADAVYLITTADIPSLRNLARSLQLIRSFGRGKRENWVRLLVNRFEPNQTVTVPEIEKTLGIDVTWTLRNDYRAVMSALNAGRPAVSDSKSAFAKDIRALAGKLTGVPVSEESPGWLSGLLSRNNGMKGSTAREKVTSNDG